MDAANVRAYLQPRYVFYNLQHVKKNILTLSHDVNLPQRKMHADLRAFEIHASLFYLTKWMPKCMSLKREF
jgi:hypothetical protein